MRISDWSSDVCSSDLARIAASRTWRGVSKSGSPAASETMSRPSRCMSADRKSVVEGKSVSVSVDLGGRRIIKKQKTRHYYLTPYTHNHIEQPNYEYMYISQPTYSTNIFTHQQL